MFQVIQIAGAFAILAAFGLSQFRIRPNDSYEYLTLNLVGGALLLVSAIAEVQWASSSSRAPGSPSPSGA